MDIDELNKLVTRAVALTRVVPLVAVPMVVVLGWCLKNANDTIDQLSKERPVMVVPGAMAGIYTTGLSDAALMNEARRLIGLGTNFTRSNAKQRFDELETYADNIYHAKFLAAKSGMLNQIEARSEGRTFQEHKDSATLQLQKDGTFRFTMRGDRTFYSGSIELNHDVADVEFVFKLMSPSKENQYGISFVYLDIHPIGGGKQSPGAQQ